MSRPSTLVTSLLIPAALLTATSGFVAGCGSGVDKAKINELKQKTSAIQSQSQKVQKDIKQIQSDVKSGKISAAAGQKKIASETKSLEKSAKSAASESIDAIKNNPHLTDAQKQQLEQAQQQINSSH